MYNIYSAITGEAAFTVGVDNVLRSAITGRPAYILPEGWGKSVKGEVATPDDLPADGNALGDQYYVTSVASFYVWNGSAWTVLSGGMSPGVIDNFTLKSDGGTIYADGECVAQEISGDASARDFIREAVKSSLTDFDEGHVLYDAGDGVNISGTTISAPAFSGGTVSVVATGGTASFSVMGGRKYVVEGEITALVVPSTQTSDYESEIEWTFAGGTYTPSFSYFMDVSVIGTLPTFEAGKSYIASVKGGKLVVAPVDKGQGVFELLVKTTGENEVWGFNPYWNDGGFCQVNWGDGAVEYATASGQVFSHTYATPGDHVVKIVGNCYKVLFGAENSLPDDSQLKIYGCNFNFAALGTLTDMGTMFNACVRLTGAGFTNVPDTVTSLGYAFDGIKAPITLTKLPPRVTTAAKAFGPSGTHTCNVTCDLDDLVANAPAGGYASLADISLMFLNAGNGVTGSAANFIAVCAPSVTYDRAFEGCPNVTDIPEA